MKNINSKRKKYIYILLGSISLLILIVWVVSRGDKQEYTLENPQKIDISQIVSVTGKVSADPEINMNFQAVGKVKKIYKKVGDTVMKGEIIAEIENDAQNIARDNAVSELKARDAELSQRIAGSTYEERYVAKTGIYKARSDLVLSKTDLDNAIRSKEKAIEKAVLQVESAEIALNNAKIDYDNLLVTTEQDITSAEKEVDSAKSVLDQSEVTYKNTTITTDKTINDSYDNVYTALNDSIIMMDNNLLESDSILGINNKTDNKLYERLLGVRSKKTYHDAKESFRLSDKSFTELKARFKVIDTKNIDDINHAYKLAVIAYKNIDILMDDMAELLDNTITDSTFSKDQLALLKTEINTLHDALNIAKDNLNTKYQIATTSLITNDTNDWTAKSTLEISDNNLEISKQRLNKIKNNAKTSLELSKSIVDERSNTLKQAQNNLEMITLEYENNISTIKAQINLKESVLEGAKANLSLVNASPRAIDIKSLQARVDQARSNLEATEYELSKTKIISPSNGIISKINIEEGSTYLGSSDRELLSAAVTVIATDLKVDADVPETDIAKVEVGDPVTMTLDAFTSKDVFEGTISKIEPAATMISGVVYYNVEAVFDKNFDKIKPGMTSNLDILTDKRTNVLALPIRAIIFEDNKTYVKVYKDNRVIEKDVELGLEGDLFIEIISGVDEQDDIIINGK